jgi:hypothetical protein
MRLAFRTRHVIAAMLVACATPSCAVGAHGTRPAPVDSVVKAGQWGGQHLAMSVTQSGTDLEFDCGKATITGAIETDRDGAFTATGTFLQERPGPTTPDGPPRRPMRLSGTVTGDDMQVRIVLTDRDEDLGSFTLTYGATARIVKCR